MMKMNEKLARAAYESYGVAVGGKAYDGSPLKQYDEFPENIKQGWEAAAERVAVDVASAAGFVWTGEEMKDGTASTQEQSGNAGSSESTSQAAQTEQSGSAETKAA